MTVRRRGAVDALPRVDDGELSATMALSFERLTALVERSGAGMLAAVVGRPEASRQYEKYRRAHERGTGARRRCGR